MWRDASKKDLAAEAMKITAADLSQLGCIDGVVPEPEGGAHTDHEGAAALLGQVLAAQYKELKGKPVEELIASRYSKFRNMAQFYRVEE
jgi:acetyl-CoA carboxylase carboxyl transferase subunit alpha